MTSAAEQSLFAAHEKIYPRDVNGRFAHLRIAAVVALLGLFYGLPWLQWDGRQAVLFDLPARKFFIFGLTFFPQDFFFLTWLLVIAALSRHSAAASGAAMPVRKRSGPRCSSGWSVWRKVRGRSA